MKMTTEHYEYMRNRLQRFALLIPQIRASIIAEGRSKDVEKRLRWDLLYLGGLSPWVCENLYSYLNDEHIDTALKRIISEISG